MTQTSQRRGTDRLPRAGAGRAERGKEIRLGLLGVLGILLLLVGVPVALAMFVGYPLPRTAPSKDWLTQSVSATLIIKILACVVWLLWAHFAVCVIAEWRALRRGRLPGDIPFAGGSQMLARRLVASALLLAGAATAFGHVGSSGPSAHSTPGIGRSAVSASQNPGQNVQQKGIQQGPMDRTDAHGTASENQAPVAKHADRVTKTYTVQTADGRNYDCLWDIAQRTLGDPMRYKEIFALNKDRIQADGSKLVDANLIRPGWQLRLPADAHGAGVHTAHARSTSTDFEKPVPPAIPNLAVPAAHALTDAGSAGVATTHEGVADFVGTTTQAAGSASSWNADLLGGGMMLAGIALALSARRGPYSTAGEDEEGLTAAADLGLALSLDRALRNLAAARADQGQELPQPVLAWTSADDVVLALGGGDMSDPPAPWRADSEAMWSCTLSEISDHPRVAEVAAPFPGLLAVGREDDHEVFVDFEQAPGLISVGGDAERGRDLVTSLAAQAVTCAWSDGAKATLVGFSDGDQLAALDTHSITHVAALSEVLDGLEQKHAGLARMHKSLGLAGVLNGRQARRSGAWAPHLIVLSGPPSAQDARRLAQLVGNGRSQFVVLVVGDLLHAAWRFVIDPQSNLDLGVLGTSVRAHQLDRNSMLQLIDTLRAAAQTAATRDAEVAGLAPRAALANTRDEQPDETDSVPLSVRAERPASGEATSSVSLLGPVTVYGPGPLDDEKRELATEIVVAVALAPTGIPDVVLRAAIWPRGVSDEVFDAAMGDAAGWLGTEESGQHALREVDGRWCLGASVWIDWENLQLAVHEAQGPMESEALRFCVSLFRGEGFSGVPATRYRWLSFRRCARDAAVIGTSVVRRTATLLGSDGQPAEAEKVLRRGLALVPTAEPIWRDLLELTGGRGPDAAAAVASEMYAVLKTNRVWAQPETDALVRQLAPGRAVAESA